MDKGETPVKVVIGIAWYCLEDWEGLRQLYPDRDQMHDSYDEWLADAKRAEGTAKARGHTVIQIVIHPAELAGWCAVRGLAPTADARARYVTEQTRLLSHDA